jgi:hypothetical protein
MTIAARTQDKPENAQTGKRLSHSAPWIGRLVLAMASVIFAAIGLRYIADPAGVSASTGVALNTPVAFTTTRIGFGAFPLALALFSFTSLLSTRRLFAGVRLIAILAATVIAVRLFSIAADGFESESAWLFFPEAILLALSLAALFLEAARQRRESEPGKAR